MEQARKGENQDTPKRSNRYYFINGVWYFDTREGKQQGPFTSKREMETELRRYIESL